MQKAKVIDSGDLLDDTEHHFRVFAGPGAGKSYWLVKHIQSVIRSSQRLSPSARIACISYTNVAADEIRSRLGDYSDRVEVSTIHSFLYRNVVKPYLHLFKKQNGDPVVAYHLVKRHDEHRPSYLKVREWLKAIGQERLLYVEQARHTLFGKLRTLAWKRQDADGEWLLEPLNFVQIGPKLRQVFSNDHLKTYKSLYWEDGIIDHEDILYFAHRILADYDVAVQCLSARFRYLFIDEFQDTHPVQTRMVERFAEHGTVVGVVGDAQQSIYGFFGAMPDHFCDFSLDPHKNYRIAKNRRSTKRIIRLLNHVRSDGLEQVCHRQEDGESVRLFCGEIEAAISRTEQLLPSGSTFETLTRKNDEASRVRNWTNEDESIAWRNCNAADSERSMFLEGVIAAAELGSHQHFALALGGLVRTITKRGKLRELLRSSRILPELACRGVAVALLEFLLTNYSRLSRGSVLAAYEEMSEYLTEQHDVSLKGVQKGKFYAFAASTTWATLASGVRPSEETRRVRTIHKAKSAEWDNVLVWFAQAARIEHILDPFGKVSPEELEERRVTYVALSRAQERLFIVVPKLSQSAEKGLRSLGIEVERL